MTGEYIDLSLYTGWLIYVLHLTYLQKCVDVVRCRAGRLYNIHIITN